MKSPAPLAQFVLISCGLLLMAGCTTLQNRRDLYFPQRVDGPYTRMLRHGLKAPAPAPIKLPAPERDGKQVIRPRS